MTYNPSDIFTLNDLKKHIISSTINGDIIIRGEHIKQLTDVEKINGFLGISDSIIESLGCLKEITGDFWISFYIIRSPLKSLGKLEKIGGDASFRYSNISHLGNLKYVGGKLSLRDTPVNNLGKLEYVGGDLYLPERLRNLIDLKKVHVVGKIQFWNDSKTKKEITSKSLLRFQKSEIEIPFWTHQYIFSSDVLNYANSEQKNFYRYYKKSFLNGIFIDIKGNDNYSFILFYDLIEEYYRHNRIDVLEQQLNQLKKYYPKTANYTLLAIIKELEITGDFASAWNYIKKGEYISIQTLWKYEQKLNKKLINGDLIAKLGGISHLTDFGKDNIEAIKPFAEKYLAHYEIEKNASFFNLFFEKDKLFKEINGKYSAEYYHKFYLSELEFNHYKIIDDRQNLIYGLESIKYVVEKAILNQFRFILKKAEDLYREEIGMPKIGEGWISETELYYKIKDKFTDYEVIHHASPDWLGRQHLDIFLPQVNIGVEYQGIQHYEPVDFFGGHETFAKNQERDERKRKLCENNNCYLIYVSENYDFDIIVAEIEERIKLVKENW